MKELQIQEFTYEINGKNFSLQTDFTYNEKDWIDIVYGKLSVGGVKSEEKNQINGSFSRDEIEKTLKILLPGLTHEDFMEMRESLQVKVIADFFLSKAILGVIINQSMMN